MQSEALPKKLALGNIVLRNETGELDDNVQLGLLYVGTSAKKVGYDVKILHGENFLSDIIEELRSGDFVGFYINSDNKSEVLRYLHYIKKEKAEVKTILGGPLANVEFKVLIKNENVDYVCRGEGENFIVELLDSNNDFQLLKEIKGLSFKNYNNPLDGTYEIKHNPPRELSRDLDSVPFPDRSLYPGKDYSIISYMSTSRGCGFKCTFCYESTQRQYRYNSAQYVLDEIKSLKETYGTTYFTFTDDIFTTHQPRLKEICRLFRENFKPHEDFIWYCESRVDVLSKRPELIEEMKSAGLKRLQIGIESGDQHVIDLYKKNITLEQAKETLYQLNEHEVLSIYTNFILGGAGETVETYLKSIEFMVECMKIAPGRLECGACFLSPYPGTDIHMNPDKYDVSILDNEFLTGTSLGGIFVETKSIKYGDILKMRNEFNLVLDETMRRLSPSIPVSLIKEHLKTRSLGLSTSWSNFFLQDPILKSWFEFSKNSNYFELLHKEDRYLEITFPHRTFSLTRISNSSIAWTHRGKKIDLGEKELLLIQLASGKSSILDIVNFYVAQFKIEKSPCVIKNITDFYQTMADELLLSFRVLR